jgi:hypothetical protein
VSYRKLKAPAKIKLSETYGGTPRCNTQRTLRNWKHNIMELHKTCKKPANAENIIHKLQNLVHPTCIKFQFDNTAHLC